MSGAHQNRRESIEIAGLRHTHPIPMASRIGRLLYSSGINGIDPATGTWAPDFARQASLVFEHMAAVMEAAGGSLDDVIKVTVYLKDLGDWDRFNEAWKNVFADPTSRPARHVLAYDISGEGMVQLEIVAVLPEETQNHVDRKSQAAEGS